MALGGALGGLALSCPEQAEGAQPGQYVPQTCSNAPDPTPADATCTLPPDAQCADATGKYAPAVNPACAAHWKTHCTCANTNQFEVARTSWAINPAFVSRSPSPLKQTFPASNAPNATHAPNYGINPDWLNNAPPSGHAAAINGSLRSGIHVQNVTAPPHAPTPQGRTGLGAKTKTHKTSTIETHATVPKSKQNTWIAQETLARAEAVNACRGRTGDQLVACAAAYMRPLHASPPRVNTCEDFVYNRFYDIERWTDRVDACGGDPICEATITLDANSGIVGKMIGASDVVPSKSATLKTFLDEFMFGGKPPPDCSKDTKLAGDELHNCEMLASFPPVGSVQAQYWNPIGGTGTAQMFMSPQGAQVTVTFGQNPAGYWASKNKFYDALPMFTPTLVAAFTSDPVKSNSVNQLVSELRRGANYFYVGKYFNGHAPQGQQKVNYPDEWAFERALYQAAKGADESTFRDYAKRRQFVQSREQAFHDLFAAAWSGSQIGFAIPTSAVDGQIAAAGAPQGLFGAAGRPGSVSARPVSATTYRPTVAGALPNHNLSSMPQAAQQVLPPAPPTAIDKFAWGSQPPQMDTSYKYPRLLCPAPDTFGNKFSSRSTTVVGMNNPMPSTPINGPAIDTQYSDVRTAACNYINAVLDEWARFNMPQVVAGAADPSRTAPAPSGCFANDPACDWDPALFMAGIEDLVKYQITNVEASQREVDYNFCRNWQPVIASEAKFKDQHDAELQMLTDMKTEVQSDFDKLSNVPVIDRGGPGGPNVAWASSKHPTKDDSFSTFGEDRHNAESWGNDLFGVGYAYDIGWEVPTEWEATTNPKAPWALCDFGVGAHAGFEAYAFAFGSDKFDVLDADLAAGANDGTNPQLPGDPNQGAYDGDVGTHAAYDANFVIAGDALAQQWAGVNFNQDYTYPLAQGANGWILFNIPFQISFVTLDIQVGVGYKYEVDLNVIPTHTSTCHVGKQDKEGKWPQPGQPSLGLTTSIGPQGEMDAIIDAYASLAGIAGVGVEVDLTLLGIGLPAANTMTLQPTNLSFDQSLVMDMHTLDGSLSVYAELVFIKLFDITIISWNGIHHQVPLFNVKETVPIPTLAKLGGQGLINPGHSMSDL
jgi:hypothetical protein